NGQHSRAYVFTSLRVVSRRREQRRRPIPMSIQVAFMKRIDAQPELLRLSADFVQRGQPVVNVKRRIFESFRHDWPGELLKLEHKMHVLLARLRVEIFRKAEQQNVAQKIEDRFLGRRIETVGSGNRAIVQLLFVVSY